MGKLVNCAQPRRILFVDGSDGSIPCLVYGRDSTLRTFLSMWNLAVFRGREEGNRMIGPLSYFGRLHEPHRYKYRIVIDEDQQVRVYSNRIEHDSNRIEHSCNSKPSRPLLPLLPSLRVRHWRWISHDSSGYSGLRHTLFPRPGVLEIPHDRLEIPVSDARRGDLSRFRARLERNTVAFPITDQVLPSRDDLRLITYFFEDGYATDQMEQGDGVFLEHHPFVQTIT